MLRLNRPLRRTSNADPDDVLGAKFAFHGFGYYDPPTGEFHPWPDAKLFEAIQSFQVDNDLDADGEMLPGGPTETALNARPASSSEPNLYQQALAKGLVREQDAVSESESWSEAFRRETKGELTPVAYRRSSDYRGNSGDILVPRDPFISGGGAALGSALAAAALQSGRPGELIAAAKRRAPSLIETDPRRGSAFEALPPQKAEPLRGPSAEEIDRINKEAARPEILPAAEPIVIQPGDLPAELPDIPQIFIFPDQSDEIDQFVIIERKGNAKTKAQIDGIRDWFLDRGWKHLKGGRDRQTHKEKEEEWIPSFAKQFGGDGRQGGRFVDLTMRSPDGKIVRIQTVTLDKNGKPIKDELNAAEDIRRRTEEHVILIPKTWQLRRTKRRGGGK